MNRPTIRTHDVSTNTITNREMNDEEFAAYEALQAADAAAAQAEADRATAKAALLTKLGITAEEAKLLLS
jgi:hypothetical protein